MMKTAGIYIHIPFCAGKCPYCDFYSRAGSNDVYDAYTDAVIKAIGLYPMGFFADTIYFGGGTPSLLGAKRLCKILSAAKARLGGRQLEVTVEANPCSVDLDMLAALALGGFNRISFGVQSLDNQTLKILGRRHTAEQAKNAIMLAHTAGFEHISADLMLCVPKQKTEELSRSIEELSALPIDHLSAYMLKLEQGTAFYKKYSEADDDSYNDFYFKTIELCREHGFVQYEISNFAKNPQAQSLHNLKYWRCEEYLGIGPAAHSFMEGKRFFFERNLNAFINAANQWDIVVQDGEGGSEEERLMLGLRLNEGVCLGGYTAEFAAAVKRRSIPLQRAGLLALNDDRLSITEKGFMVSNSVIAALI